MMYSRAPKTVTVKLQRVLNAATRVVSNTPKFDRGLSLTSLLDDALHWLGRELDVGWVRPWVGLGWFRLGQRIWTHVQIWAGSSDVPERVSYKLGVMM